MIESIQLNQEASYISPQELKDLSRFNFVFGTNGSGKTTISRILDDENSYPSCTVNWKTGRRLETIVYNQDFVERNFHQSNELEGVFTLGEENHLIEEQIASAKKEIRTIDAKIEGCVKLLNGSENHQGAVSELSELEEEYKNKFWKQKQKYDKVFLKAFSGYRKNVQKFKDKILQESKNNSAELRSLEELLQKAKRIFDSESVALETFPQIDVGQFENLEKNSIMTKCIIGKKDVNISNLISKLNNSDWVRQGIAFLNDNQEDCPFCQQRLPSNLRKELNQYFDDMYESDLKDLARFHEEYKKAASQISETLGAIALNEDDYLKPEALDSQIRELRARFELNTQRIELKIKEPSRAIELEPVTEQLSAIGINITLINGLRAKKNEMIQDRQNKEQELTSEIWKYICESELAEELREYKAKQERLNKKIKGISDKEKEWNAKRTDQINIIQHLERQTTSVQPTVQAINEYLKDVGFSGFSIQQTNDRSLTYKLVRPNGEDAKSTLSEGEKTFVTFLYFFQLLKGSKSTQGINLDRVVVIDDPVSSLDSDILFFVSTLIRELCEEIRNDSSSIKQIIVLTHNVYFFKEVTFSRKLEEAAINKKQYWTVRKPKNSSIVKHHNKNPIKSSYELLWQEIKNPENSGIAIQNTIRRILEYYFKIIGSFEFEDIWNRFSGREKHIARALFSWVNDGSHYTQDDLHISTDVTTVEKYLDVFKRIFYEMKHESHYEMMMREVSG